MLRTKRFSISPQQLYWVLPGVLVLAVFWGLSQGIGAILVAIRSQENPGVLLNIIPNKKVDWPVDLRWVGALPDTGNRPTPAKQDQIEAAYLNAWMQVALSYEKGEPYGLSTYFSGPALQQMTEAIESGLQQGHIIQQVNTHHRLRLNFFAADETLLSMTDTDARVTRIVRNPDGSLLYSGQQHDTYDVIMMVDKEGNWQIRHLLRVDAASPFVIPVTAQTQFDAKSIAGINYYPANTPWDLFWEEYDVAQTVLDMQRMRKLQLNTVRIFIPYQQFGGSQVQDTYLAKLTSFLDLAEKHQLQVMITLFDFSTDYALIRWPRTDHHMVTIMDAVKEHPALFAWDIKNEPDLDYLEHDETVVNLWLGHKVDLAQRTDPKHPVTIGWAAPKSAATLAEKVDLVSFHYYAPANEFEAELVALEEEIGAKPLLLQEFGVPTWNSWIFPNGHTQAEQAQYFSEILQVVRDRDNMGYMAWTLYDFAHVPNTVVPPLPWLKGPQQHLGVLAADGTPKFAATYLAPNAALDTAPQLAVWERFIKPFWLTVYTISIMSVVACGWILRKYRRERVAVT